MDPRRFDFLKERAPPVHRFLTSGDKPYPVLREVAVGALLVFLVLGTLWGYTGQPIGRSPVVVVESGSMMHCKNDHEPQAQFGRGCDPTRWGRLGTIDPGDLILVKDVDGRGDVATQAGGGEHHYGRSGDVIIFKLDGGQPGQPPIIHRALFWLEVNSDDTFSIPALGLSHVRDLDHPAIQELGLQASYAQRLRDRNLDDTCGPVGPARSGYITRGDNNPTVDQDINNGLANCPVKVAWVLGIARGEIPWLGLVKLLANDLMTGRTNNFADAGSDSKVLLFVTLALLLGGPVVFEKVRARRREARELDEQRP